MQDVNTVGLSVSGELKPADEEATYSPPADPDSNREPQ